MSAPSCGPSCSTPTSRAHRNSIPPRSTLDTRRLFSQYLFSYKLNPQTVLFVGYSDNSVGDQANQLQRQNRTFFTKVGYAWIM